MIYFRRSYLVAGIELKNLESLKDLIDSTIMEELHTAYENRNRYSGSERKLIFVSPCLYIQGGAYIQNVDDPFQGLVSTEYKNLLSLHVVKGIIPILEKYAFMIPNSGIEAEKYILNDFLKHLRSSANQLNIMDKAPGIRIRRERQASVIHNSNLMMSNAGKEDAYQEFEPLLKDIEKELSFKQGLFGDTATFVVQEKMTRLSDIRDQLYYNFWVERRIGVKEEHKNEHININLNG